MIVPSSRLLWWVGLAVVPLATLGGILTDSAALAIGVVGLLFALAGLDAIRGLGVLDGLRVELPPVTRFSKDREGGVELLVHNESRRGRELRFGLPLPREFESPHEDLTARMPEGSALAKLSWPVTPRRRGSYRIDRCHLECASPFGLWAMRRALPVQGELRVYPNLMSERRSVAALFLNRGSHGSHAIRQVGKGREFEKLREYVPGDSFEDVHWKATARRGRPVTKVFQVERTQEVYVVLDTSRLTARVSQRQTTAGEKNETVLERFLTAALVLGLAAEQQGDLFGLLTFSDRVGRFVRARNGKDHYAICRDALYTLEAEGVTPDFEEVCSFIRLRMRKRALVVFLTALDDPLLAESFTRSVQLISDQHLVIVNTAQPPGARPLFGNPDVTTLDELYQELGGHLQWARLRELGKTLERRGVKFSALADERLCAEIIRQYLEVKRRQVL
jgi:uncharacterized protein (DUF58 family)